MTGKICSFRGGKKFSQINFFLGGGGGGGGGGRTVQPFIPWTDIPQPFQLQRHQGPKRPPGR